MLSNPTYYSTTLKKYSLSNQGQLLEDSTHRNMVNMDAKSTNMSDLINNFNGEGNNNWADTSRSSNFTKGEQDLPLNSIAKMGLEID